ncbi:MAG: DNA helicase [Clostridium lundense]|nr:DNA helicase [Clostridium lundense]
MLKLRGKQQEVLNLPYDGHNVVLGVAGSGKSVCATQRSAFLSKVTEEKVLLLSFNNSLVNYLDDISKGYLSNVSLRTYHSFATEYMRQNGLLHGNEILTKDWEKESLIKEAIECIKRRIGNNSTLERREFIIEEIKWMQRIGALERTNYENIERLGRGNTRLLKENRKYIFDVYEEYIQLRAKKGYRYDWDDISYYFYMDANERSFTGKYKHIIIDEGQDFSPAMIKSIVAYMKKNGSVLFFGDTAQQIYGNKISWKKSGLNIRKVYNLDENYRNTIEIEYLANEIRNNMALAEEEITNNTNSLSKGEIPSLISFNNEIEEFNFVAAKAKELSNDGSIAVVFKKNNDVIEFTSKLDREKIPYTKVDRDTKNFANLKGIFVGTYYSTKGLEFDSVIIPYCTDSHLIDNGRALALDSEQEVNSEVSKLLYVAVTRAKKRLLITYTNEVVRVFPKNKNLYKSVKGGI